MRRMRSLKTTIMIVMATLLFWACSSYFIHWNTLAYQKEAANAISEATLHASKSISNLINGELDMLAGIADSISEINYHDWTETKNYLNHFVKKFHFTRISIDSAEGIGYASDGTIFDVTDEEGFIKALHGDSNISNPLMDKVTGKEIITLNSPITFSGKIKGVLSASRYTQELYDYLAVSFFNGEGYSHIIDQSGRVILRSPHQSVDQSIDNVFDVASYDPQNEDELQRFKQDVSVQNSGVAMLSMNGKEKLIGYSPIQEVNGWYILSVIPTKVILSKAYAASRATFLFCSVMFVILAGIFAVILLRRRKNRKEIERIAFVDELTGLPRMKKFRLDAQQILDRNPKTRYAVIQFDVDQFKYINEILGFQGGNLILMELAKVLKEHAGDQDLVGRLGGDRFIMMTPYDNREELTDRLYTLLTDLSEYRLEGEERYKLIVNCGVYCKEDNRLDILMMIDRAGIACKSIKGGYTSACTFFDDELLAEILEEQDIVNKMQLAMEQDEFKVYLQPKVDVHTNQILGAEALVRWEDPQKGLVSPTTFIPIFERNRFIMALDFWMIEIVCQMLHKWLLQGYTTLPISVNISLVTLYRCDFVAQLHTILNRNDVPAALLEIELTESIVFGNLEVIRDRIMELKRIGCTIAIDDFGSGYSSLNVLQHIPADVIKLDRVFLISRSIDEAGKIVIASMVDLARKLHMKVVAEGVETQRQVDFLKKVNCDIGQGYYFAKPMSIDKFEEQYYRDTRVTV